MTVQNQLSLKKTAQPYCQLSREQNWVNFHKDSNLKPQDFAICSTIVTSWAEEETRVDRSS